MRGFWSNANEGECLPVCTIVTVKSLSFLVTNLNFKEHLTRQRGRLKVGMVNHLFLDLAIPREPKSFLRPSQRSREATRHDAKATYLAHKTDELTQAWNICFLSLAKG